MLDITKYQWYNELRSQTNTYSLGGKYMKNLEVKFQQLIEECETIITGLGYELPKIEYKLNGRMTSSRGSCKQLVKNKKYIINLAKFMIEGAILNKSDHEPMRTILHEICHALPNGMDHTGNWKIYVDHVNRTHGFDITRCSSLPVAYDTVRERKKPNRVMVTIGYTNGCHTWTRPTTSVHVRKIENYHAKCGGKLEII